MHYLLVCSTESSIFSAFHFKRVPWQIFNGVYHYYILEIRIISTYSNIVSYSAYTSIYDMYLITDSLNPLWSCDRFFIVFDCAEISELFDQFIRYTSVHILLWWRLIISLELCKVKLVWKLDYFIWNYFIYFSQSLLWRIIYWWKKISLHQSYNLPLPCYLSCWKRIIMQCTI